MAITRNIAISILDAALREKTPPEAIPVKRFAQQAISEEDERFVRAMVLTTLRHLGQLDALIDLALEKPLPSGKHWVKCAIRIGLAQACLMRVAPHAAIHATVQAIKKSKYVGLAGLANAVLRRYTDKAPALPHPMHNIPEWLLERWLTHFGKMEVQAIANIAQHIPATDVHYLQPIELTGATPLNAHMLRLPQTHEVVEQEGFATGAFFVQDYAASFPVVMLGDIAGKKLLEIGAAPGGKTAQLCAAGGEVTALDRSATRSERLRENMQRLGFTPEIVVRDVLEYQADSAYDVIVLDAPCSATGTWRRHPEVVHLIEMKDVEELAQLQARMLAHVWPWLKVGGTLLYIVCSLEPEEGELQVAQFLQQTQNAVLRPAQQNPLIYPAAIAPSGYLRTHPAMMADSGGMDGFFAAMIEKIA